ncbi:acetylxylan esterase [Armatimonadota bacterium]|nr:acetylxylan esterase [Armatimonadota bacterium]
MLWSSVGTACALGLMAVVGQTTSYPSVEALPVISGLPDPFLRSDGTRIQSKREWERQRKALLNLILHYEYGELPPTPRSVKAEILAAQPIEGVAGTEQEILLTMGPKGGVSTHLFLAKPEGEGTFPVLITGDLNWGRIKPEIVRAIVQRGYILAVFNREEIASDNNAHHGVYRAYPNYKGGRLAAWAWGYHRVIDYLLTLPNIDGKHIGVTGHSRGGKAALLAGATDTRIALTAPNNSGCGGAGCFRILDGKCEDITAILKNFPFWFSPHFQEFIGKIDHLPFDQHTAKALIAPRSLLTTEALGDHWANPQGTQITHSAAKEVFDFLGVGERIGIRFREGGHEHNLQDWTALLDFADIQFFGKKASSAFTTLAFPNAERGHTWERPAK